MSDQVSRLNAALEGRYAIERELGEGGMATVYLADDLKHERKVALKVLKPELAAVVGAERFLAEIKTTANLQHPHILPLFDSGEADSFLFYVMPHVQGESLRERIDREKQLAVGDSLAITQKVASALDYAHGNGVVHRDIKPANILLSEQGEPLVADFGIALAVAQAGAGRITETGLSLGTPHYMSPEQATGDRDVDPRSDVYALGCVLYEMLAGQPPFSATTAQAVLVKILTADAPSITSERRTVPPHVGYALAKALEKLPADRFTSAAEFVTALGDEGFTYKARTRTETATIPAEALVPIATAQPWHRDSRSVTAVLIGAIMMALAAWGWLKPVPPLPVTRASIRLDDFSFRTLGDIMVSPDGSRFAVAGLTVPAPIYWRNAQEDEFRPLPGTERAEYASFSPDGQSLAFATDQGGTIQRVALSGGAPQRVADIPSPSIGGIDWGDDGHIVFTLNGGRGLFRVPATGGEPELLLERTVNSLRNPKLLPGGGAVIFTDRVTLSTHFLDLETDSVRVVRTGAIDAIYVQTGHLLYADVAGTLWVAAFDPEEGEVLGEPVVVFDGLAKPNHYYARFSVSRNGTLVYGARPVGGQASSGQRLVLMDLEGNEEAAPLDPRPFRGPRWPPDGESVAYFGSEPGESVSAFDIYTYNVALRTVPRRLTFEGDNRWPVWSPDGTSIAFASRSGTAGFDLFVKRVNDDSPPQMFVTLPGDQFPTNWPSDDLLLFEHRGGNSPSALWMVDPSSDSAVPRSYLESEALLQYTMLSPDGDLTAYHSLESGTHEVYVRSFPEARQPEIVSRGGGRSPSWSPDGNMIYYWTAGPDTPPARLIAARIERGPPFVVISRDTTMIRGTYRLDEWDLHPDGDRVVILQDVNALGGVTAADGAPRFIVVTNWFEELRQRMGN